MVDDHVLDLKGEDETGGSRKLRNYELRDMNPLPCIIMVIKSWVIRWAGYVAHVGEMRYV
jgi:hypothetical protein